MGITFVFHVEGATQGDFSRLSQWAAHHEVSVLVVCCCPQCEESGIRVLGDMRGGD